VLKTLIKVKANLYREREEREL